VVQYLKAGVRSGPPPLPPRTSRVTPAAGDQL